MMVTQLIAFVGVSLVVICTPGPDTALTVRNALSGGRRSGVWTAAGVALGQAIWTLAASLGIAGLIHASEPAFLALKYFGAAYLIYLGMQSLRSAWRGGDDHGAASPRRRPLLTPGRSLRHGLINDLANPKMAAFFMSLLPQFAPDGGGAFAGMLALGLLFSLLTFAWLSLYSILIDRARALFDRSRVRRALDAVTGSVLIAFGVRLALTQR
ncbi:lysine transporter LysE [Microtetraspora sp. NBRC 13810]|uniref:LysE family translocator n=1 Tax=Microtetraspora sp. NBRC 13810 TaxID=3030990 RepID=UPI0024A2725F|nr:LysE family translocator [Microtetraspora sp. NBRC 13810]GLW06254.1 lysine transporter LysE [Microtetraspora sp. NBRC 13810]